MALWSSLPDDELAYATQLLQPPEHPGEPPPHLDARQPLAELASRYLDLLLLGERQQASTLILAAAESGVGVDELYLRQRGRRRAQDQQREVGKTKPARKHSRAPMIRSAMARCDD